MRLIDADAYEHDLMFSEEVYEAVDDDALRLVLNKLSDAPTVDAVERKSGKWIDAWRSGFDGTRHWHRECSECGYERDDDSIDKDTRFCPNCGADMREEGKINV